MTEWKMLNTRVSGRSEKEKFFKKIQDHENKGWKVHPESFGMTSPGLLYILLSKD